MKTTMLISALCLSGLFQPVFAGSVPATFAGTTSEIKIKISDKQQNAQKEVFVELLNAQDSSVVSYAVTDEKGNVEFDNLHKGKYIIYVPQPSSTDYMSPTIILNPNVSMEISSEIIVNAATKPEPLIVGCISSLCKQ